MESKAHPALIQAGSLQGLSLLKDVSRAEIVVAVRALEPLTLAIWGVRGLSHLPPNLFSAPSCWWSKPRLLSTFRVTVPEMSPALTVGMKLGNQCHSDCLRCSRPHRRPQAARTPTQNDPTTRDRLTVFWNVYPDHDSKLSPDLWHHWRWCGQSQGKFLRKKKPILVIPFLWKRRIRKEMAGGEGEGKEQKWGVFDAVVCARMGGARGDKEHSSISISAGDTEYLWSVARASHIRKTQKFKRKCLFPGHWLSIEFLLANPPRTTWPKKQKTKNLCLRTAGLKSQKGHDSGKCWKR